MIPLRVGEDSYALTVSEDKMSLAVAECLPGGYPEWDGPVEFEPASEAQVVPVHGYALTRDITIDPIPSNYGLITYDGTSIRVS